MRVHILSFLPVKPESHFLELSCSELAVAMRVGRRDENIICETEEVILLLLLSFVRACWPPRKSTFRNLLAKNNYHELMKMHIKAKVTLDNVKLDEGGQFWTLKLLSHTPTSLKIIYINCIIVRWELFCAFPGYYVDMTLTSALTKKALNRCCFLKLIPFLSVLNHYPLTLRVPEHSSPVKVT